MTDINTVYDIVNSIKFEYKDYLGAELQLLEFADNYAKLSPEEAEELRSVFDSKQRLGLFATSTSLFRKCFTEADAAQKDRLCKIFFALYSFDNLDFGYDSLLHVMSVADQIKAHRDLAKKHWNQFKVLTSRSNAIGNLENKLFFD